MNGTLKSFMRPAAVVLALAAAPATNAAEQERLLGLMDTSRLGAVHDVEIPPASRAFDATQSLRPASAGPALAREVFEVVGTTPQRVYAQSAGFTYELRKRRAGLLLLRKEGQQPGAPIEGGPAALAGDARTRLLALGLPGVELGPADSRRLLVKGQDLAGQIQPTQVAGFKHFFERTLAGIPVLDSRAVVTYEPGLRFAKALVYWPTLAPEGHALTSSMTPAEAAAEVARQLVATGETDVTGSIPLRWVYDATTDAEARLVLALRVEATLLEPPSSFEDDPVEKTRVRLFALPR